MPASAAAATPRPIHRGFFERRPNGDSPKSSEGRGALAAGGTAFATGRSAGARTGAVVGTSIGTGTGRGGADGGAATGAGGNPASTITDSAGSAATFAFGGGKELATVRAEAIVARTSA
jgi:hypothetical protein